MHGLLDFAEECRGEQDCCVQHQLPWRQGDVRGLQLRSFAFPQHASQDRKQGHLRGAVLLPRAGGEVRRGGASPTGIHQRPAHRGE